MTTFEELPQDWPERSLMDPELLCGVVDLFVRLADREQGVIMAFLTSPALRLLQPISIDDVPVGCDEFHQHELVHRLCQVVQQVCPGGGLALAVARPGALVQTHWDQTWRSALALACQDAGVTDLGCYLAVPAGTIRLDDSRVAAA
ncbi:MULTISPECIES: hypothetical protein [unclassified Luteococcus]|uniref:hypothetical protein n=1 Tax=unclassified Luteococcus TaxID=2639923 RepID=UPI00313CB5D2